MATNTLVYGVRIRNVENTVDDWVFTSNPTDLSPYVAEAPTGDGQELDPLKGSVTVGQYRIKLVDWLTGPNTRAVTSILADVNGRLQQLSRLVFIETSTNGAPYVPLVAGYTTEVQLTDAMHFEFTIGNTRRIELNTNVFQTATPLFNGVSCALGGPIQNGWGPVDDHGPVLFVVNYVSAAVVGIQWVAGPAPPAYTQINFLNVPPNRRGMPTGVLNNVFNRTAAWAEVVDTWIASDNIYASYAGNSASPAGPGVFSALYDFTSRALLGQFPMLASKGNAQPSWLAHPDPFGNPLYAGFHPIMDQMGQMNLNWPSGDAIPQPVAGTLFYVYMFPSQIDADHPVHIMAHPMDIIANLDLENGVMNDGTSVAAVRLAIGPDVRLACRITKSSTMADWKEQYVYIPFGVGARVNALGQMQYFTTRVLPNTPPTATIGIDDVRDDKTIAFDLDDAAACTAISLTTLRFTPDTKVISDKTAIVEQIFNLTDGSSLIAGASPLTDTLEAAILFAQDTFEAGLGAPFQASQDPTLDDFANSIGAQVFGLFGGGANYCEKNCLPNITVDVGDLAIVTLPDVPGASLTQTPIMQRGTPRVMMVIRRTETPAGPNLKLIDIGESAAQTIVPTFTLAAGNDGRFYAFATLTNVSALTAITGLVVRVEVAFATSPAGNGVPLAYLNPNTTSTWRSPRIDAGMPISVRMRSEVPATLPGPWSAWQTITLTPLNPVTSPVAFLGSAGDFATIAFVPGETDFATVVRLVEGTPGVPAPGPVAGLGTIIVTPNPVNLTIPGGAGEIIVTPNPVNLTLSGGSSGGVGANPANPNGRIGFSVQSSDSARPGYATGWSLMTPGGLMVPETADAERYLVPSASSPTALNFSFAALDALVNQALAASIDIKLYAFTGNNPGAGGAYSVVTSQAAAEDFISTYATQMAAHYGDIFSVIIAVNESLLGGGYTNNPLYANWTSPEDFSVGYIPYILTALASAFPSARMALNVGHLEIDSTQRAAAVTQATGLVGAGKPLHEYESEHHVFATDFASGLLASNLAGLTSMNASFAALPITFGISEFDVCDNTGEGAGTAGIPARDAINAGCVDLYGAWFNAQPNATDFIFWNPSDNISWENPAENPGIGSEFLRTDGAAPRPDLLDATGAPKTAYIQAQIYFPQLGSLPGAPAPTPPPPPPPPPSGGGGGNEPSGMTIVGGFDGSAMTTAPSSDSRFIIDTLGTMVLDTSGSGFKIPYPPSLTGGDAPVVFSAGPWTFGAGTGTMYFRAVVWFSANWTCLTNSTIKLFEPRTTEEGSGAGSTENHIIFGSADVVSTTQVTWSLGLQGPNGQAHDERGPSSSIISTGNLARHVCEMICVQDSVGGAGDGTLQTWVDGVLGLNVTGMNYIASGQTKGWPRMAFEPTYGGGTASPPNTIPNIFWGFDNLYISLK